MKETKLTNEIEHFYVTVKVSELSCIYSAALLCCPTLPYFTSYNCAYV